MLSRKRFDAMVLHYNQLSPKNQSIVTQAFEILDDFIEDELLEQYHHTLPAPLLREYRKFFSLAELRKFDTLRHNLRIESRKDGHISHIKEEEQHRYLQKREKEHTRRKHLTHIEKITRRK